MNEDEINQRMERSKRELFRQMTSQVEPGNIC